MLTQSGIHGSPGHPVTRHKITKIIQTSTGCQSVPVTYVCTYLFGCTLLHDVKIRTQEVRTAARRSMIDDQ